jgi:glutamate dehydrogenase (NAD(P)+)
MRIVGIMDREKSLLAPEGLSAAEVEGLVRGREDKLLPREDTRLAWGEERTRLWDLRADVFVSAAASGTLDEAALARMERAGVRTIACGANQPFRESRIGATRVQRMADERFTVIPDVVANCGMARAFSYLMEDGAGADTAPVFAAVDRTISTALGEVRSRLGGRETGLLGASFALALDRLG